jgi:NADPH:quinone reductase-like Zn-dependent oxidoreductase
MRAAWYEHKGGPKESLVDGDLRSTIAARFPLERIAEAHELVEAGAPGRVLVEI